jgi:hypothetical protein
LLTGGRLFAALLGVAVSACQSPRAAPTSANGVTPVYNKQTGVLEQLVADRRTGGRADMRAQMNGAQVKSVEIDRNGDGRPDRWEYYEPAGAGPRGGPRSLLVRAEEANGADAAVTRREFYASGLIQRVEEDTDADGRVDKWEQYEHGALVRMDLDLAGRGFPDRRMIYGADGSLERTEIDAAGDGRFKAGRRE